MSTRKWLVTRGEEVVRFSLGDLGVYLLQATMSSGAKMAFKYLGRRALFMDGY